MNPGTSQADLAAVTAKPLVTAKVRRAKTATTIRQALATVSRLTRSPATWPKTNAPAVPGMNPGTSQADLAAVTATLRVKAQVISAPTTTNHLPLTLTVAIRANVLRTKKEF